MFQPIEVTGARSVWLDSPTDDADNVLMLGFANSCRVQIDVNPAGMSDWQEEGDCYRVTLLGGLWPDDDELRLMVLGVIPDSDQSKAYLNAVLPDEARAVATSTALRMAVGTGTLDPKHQQDFVDAAIKQAAMALLKAHILIMPAWANDKQRDIFVRVGLPKVQPATIKSEAEDVNEQQSALPFGMWLLQVEAALGVAGITVSDTLLEDEHSANAIKQKHESGLTPQSYAAEIVAALHEQEDTNATPGHEPGGAEPSA